jgi:hypothetical protein
MSKHFSRRGSLPRCTERWKVGSTAGVISGLSPGTEKAGEGWRRLVDNLKFLMELRTLLLLAIIMDSSIVGAVWCNP